MQDNDVIIKINDENENAKVNEIASFKFIAIAYEYYEQNFAF